MSSDRSFEEELKDFILEDSEIASYVRDRVGPIPLPQGTDKASITYFEKSRDNFPTQTDPGRLAAHRWQIDAWATTYGIMRQLGEAIRKRLNGYDGSLGGFSRVSFFMENKFDTFEDKSKLFRGMLDFTVWYREEL